MRFYVNGKKDGNCHKVSQVVIKCCKLSSPGLEGAVFEDFRKILPLFFGGGGGIFRKFSKTLRFPLRQVLKGDFRKFSRIFEKFFPPPLGGGGNFSKIFEKKVFHRANWAVRRSLAE